MTILSENDLNEIISTKLTDWKILNGAIERQFLFKNFSQALAFLVQIGIEQERANHHAEIHHVYNKIKIRLNTHSANSITNLDTQLALIIDTIFGK